MARGSDFMKPAHLEEMITALRLQKLTIGFAESCTGGLLSSTLTAQAGVSDIFQGSIVSYSNEVKHNILGVKKETLQEHGAVSKQTVQEMAVGAKKLLKTDVTVSVSGIAGPSGGTKEKPVGTIFFYFLGPDFEICEQKLFAGSRGEIQSQCVEFTVNSILNALS